MSNRHELDERVRRLEHRELPDVQKNIRRLLKRVKELEEGKEDPVRPSSFTYADGRADEREQIVAYLEGMAGGGGLFSQNIRDALAFAAQRIKDGKHWEGS